jgi:hypothetical protein
MIQKLVLTPKNRVAIHVVDYLANHDDYDFYYTKDNVRMYVTDERSLRMFARESVQSYVAVDQGDYQGIILVWRSDGAGTSRYYVKINAISAKVATDLLTILTWNFNKELYVKIRKDSPLVEAFKYKGFRFVGGRGSQILLQRKPAPYEIKIYEKEADK